MPRPRAGIAIPDQIAQAREGSFAATARLISLAEDPAATHALAQALEASPTGQPHAIGITGAPGVGKSTTISALIRRFRADGRKVAVLAVDPSSPYTGGALLGDRVRMREHSADPGVFIRSLASRGALGGLSGGTPRAIRVLGAAGFDVVIVETVGAGQSEVDVLAIADTVVVISAPGLGDDVQAAKAGILEIADIHVVNKADNPTASRLVHQLRQTAALGQFDMREGDWIRPVVTTVASDGDVEKLSQALAAHRQWLRDGGAGRRSPARGRLVLRSYMRGMIDAWMAGEEGKSRLAEVFTAVEAGELGDWAAAASVLRAVAAAVSGEGKHP
jgi:LAO/AO transport system kinase